MHIVFSKDLDFQFEQYATSSCSSNSMCTILYLLMKKYNMYPFVPSRLFVYYNGRKFLNQTEQDAGLTLDALLHSINHDGICPESMWSFDKTKIREKPSAMCYDFAKSFPFRIDYEVYNLKEVNWIDLFCKSLLDKKLILLSLKRQTGHNLPVGEFNTFPEVNQVEFYHHIACIGINTDEKLVYVIDSHAHGEKNIATFTFEEMENLNPVEPLCCVLNADFSKVNFSSYYNFYFKRPLFFNFSEDYYQTLQKRTKQFNELFGSNWCFHGETSLFILFEKYYPSQIMVPDENNIHVLVKDAIVNDDYIFPSECKFSIVPDLHVFHVNDFPLLTFESEEERQQGLNERFQKIKSIYGSCVFRKGTDLICNTKQYVETELTFDHIIVGAGLTGRYLANKLSNEFPHESILILDENMYENNSIVSNCELIPYKNFTSYTKNKAPLTADLFDPYLEEETTNVFFGTEYDIQNFYSITESIYKNYNIDISKFLDGKNDFTSEELYTTMERLSSIEELCVLSVEKYLYKYNIHFDFEHFKEVTSNGGSHSRRPLLPTNNNTMYLFLKELVTDFLDYLQNFGEDVVKESLHDLVRNFNRIGFGDLLYSDENEGNKYLVNNIHVKNIDEIRNEISVCIKGNTTREIYSSRFQIGFQELYICAFNSDILKEDSDLNPDDELTLHLLFPNTEKVISAVQNEIYHVYNEKIWLTIRNAEDVLNVLQQTFPLDIRKQFFYEIDVIPNALDILQQSLPNIDIMEKCIGFLVTEAPNYGTNNSKNVYETMMKDLNLSNTIHYFNITKSILPHVVDGSLYLVEKYLNNMKTLYIKNVQCEYYDPLGTNLVGFKKTNEQISDVIFLTGAKHEILNEEKGLNLIKRSEYKNDMDYLIQTYKETPIFACCFHFQLLFSNSQLVELPVIHQGYFDVYCCVTNKIKYKGIYFENYYAFPLDNFDSGEYRVLTYFILNGQKYVASVQHKYQQIYGYQYHPLESERVYQNNFRHYIKTLAESDKN